jgi:hypothetical protein
MMFTRLHRLLLASFLLAALPLAGAGNPTGDAVEGARIAAELRAMRPAADTNWTGVLKIRKSGGPIVEIPLSCYIFVETDRWMSVYNSSSTTNGPAEKLVVTRPADGRTEYDYWVSPTDVKLPAEPRKLTGAEANIPFAGSDFYLGDLGLEFLQWPVHLLQPGQMRRGQTCYVLDSINPNPEQGGYARVRSWIQKEYLGLLMAEAYDGQGKLVKEFAAGSFDRGTGQLKDMEIRSVPDRSRTEIEFDIVE